MCVGIACPRFPQEQEGCWAGLGRGEGGRRGKELRKIRPIFISIESMLNVRVINCRLLHWSAGIFTWDLCVTCNITDHSVS